MSSVAQMLCKATQTLEGHDIRPHEPVKQDIELEVYLERAGYYNVRILEDGIVCNSHFLFTDAVIINPDYCAYERRVCYPKNGLAEKMCLGMVSVEDAPLPGYTALK